MKRMTNTEIITKFMKQDELNAMFVRMAVEQFAAGLLEAEATQDNRIISTMLLQDIAHDWVQLSN